MKTYILSASGITTLGSIPTQEANSLVYASLGKPMEYELEEKELQTSLSECQTVRAVTFPENSPTTTYAQGFNKAECCGATTLLFENGSVKCSNCLKTIECEVVQ